MVNLFFDSKWWDDILHDQLSVDDAIANFYGVLEEGTSQFIPMVSVRDSKFSSFCRYHLLIA